MGASGPSGVAAAALSDGSWPMLTVLATSARSRFLGYRLTAPVTAAGSGHVSTIATTTELDPCAISLLTPPPRSDSRVGSWNLIRHSPDGAASLLPPGPPHVSSLAVTTYQVGVAPSTWNTMVAPPAVTRKLWFTAFHRRGTRGG